MHWLGVSGGVPRDLEGSPFDPSKWVDLFAGVPWASPGLSPGASWVPVRGPGGRQGGSGGPRRGSVGPLGVLSGARVGSLVISGGTMGCIVTHYLCYHFHYHRFSFFYDHLCFTDHQGVDALSIDRQLRGWTIVVLRGPDYDRAECGTYELAKFHTLLYFFEWPFGLAEGPPGRPPVAPLVLLGSRCGARGVARGGPGGPGGGSVGPLGVLSGVWGGPSLPLKVSG